jgi:Flp pilus assembly protein TadD
MYNGSAAPADDKACAVKLADRAALLDADDPLVLTARCLVLTMVGEFEAADGLVARALQLEPSSPCNGNNLVGIATAHFGSGRYEEAAAWTSKALREQPQMQWANRTLAASYARLGEQTEALRCSDTLRRYAPGLTVGQVLDAVPFRQHHLDRLGEALHDLGLPD